MFTVDQSCIKCGACVDVCPPGVIELTSAGPCLVEVSGCIRCGHCVAVCPRGALDSDITPLKDQKPLERFPVLDADTAEQFLRSRRSIRCYEKRPVEREKILRLLNVARMAETGGNRQGISFAAVTDSNLIDQLKRNTIAYFQRENDPGRQRPVNTYLTTGKDTIFLGAPCIILALADSPELAAANSRYMITYAELYATSLGLGSCWAGFFEAYASRNQQEVRNILSLPEDLFVGGAFMLGYPQYRYYRLVDRDPLKITWR